jgi:hypothetical protein
MRIVNARGVPGTLGCCAHSLSDGSQAMLTTHHVLMGAGARARDPVYDEHGRQIGRAEYGRLGIVQFEGSSYHIDCAVASLTDERQFASGVGARAKPGDRVTKRGAATGLTSGIVVDASFSAPALIDGREREAPRQLLIRSTESGTRFSAEGDSGAVVRNAGGAIVALLWGTSACGDAVACHIAPVLHVLHFRA